MGDGDVERGWMSGGVRGGGSATLEVCHKPSCSLPLSKSCMVDWLSRYNASRTHTHTPHSPLLFGPHTTYIVI